jgi:hypothetical protein
MPKSCALTLAIVAALLAMPAYGTTRENQR